VAGVLMTGMVAYTRRNVSKTSKPKDKRARMDLELFVLALASRGLATPYDLKASASISPGASIPVLNRLESGGYVRKGEGGPRNRQEYVITAKGNAFLENSWRELFEATPSTDIEVVLRTATLALTMGEPKRSVAAYLIRASALRNTAKEAEPARPDRGTTPAYLFLRMRRVAAAGRLQSEAAILRKLASDVRRLK
jgi:DNA-binding PadR family transcriptional regulator